ncbi:MAG TPA: hypothetical protein VI876_02455 [Dehalococcoidia bacterium]|nr:hypothetical protein [Dehalococcoidia bacterium]
MTSGGLFYSRDDTDAVAEPQLAYSNPHKQRVGPRWVRGEVVFAMPLGIVTVDPEQTRWAKEYVVVHSVDGGPQGRPERVPGQFGIYDSRPGDPHYSPIWRYNYVLVPRDYVANTLRSEEDCLNSGFPIIESDVYTN